MSNFSKHIFIKYSPLQNILFAGILLRLLSVIFSKGFGWFDDHFLIIESSQSWVDGYDYNYWLPSDTDPSRVPQGHSFFYIGIHFLIFKFLKIVGFVDPQAKMYVIRFLHAAWSLLIITYGYKIAERLSNRKAAIYTALFLSLFWFMPFLSVRNLVEYVCIPPLLMATFFLINYPNKRSYLVAGILLGIAFSIRFQSLFYASGIALALILNRTQLKYLLLCFAGFALTVIATQGGIDYFIWGKPFVEFLAYVQYNIDNATVYGTDIWHMYLDLILGLLIPPLSFLLFVGWIVNWKKLPILFWPVFIYLAFHTYFPNKQERFVITILPTLIIIGTIGMFQIYEKYKERINQKLLKACKIFVATVNIILLLVFTVSYSKRNRCEAMYFLSKQPDLNMVMIEDGNKEHDFQMPPLYYLGKWHPLLGITKQFPADSALYYNNAAPDSIKANYVVFFQAENLEERLAKFKKSFPNTTYVTTIEPSFIDKTLHWMNPMNDNQTTYIYRINKP